MKSILWAMIFSLISSVSWAELPDAMSNGEKHTVYNALQKKLSAIRPGLFADLRPRLVDRDLVVREVTVTKWTAPGKTDAESIKDLRVVFLIFWKRSSDGLLGYTKYEGDLRMGEGWQGSFRELETSDQ